MSGVHRWKDAAVRTFHVQVSFKDGRFLFYHQTTGVLRTTSLSAKFQHKQCNPWYACRTYTEGVRPSGVHHEHFHDVGCAGGIYHLIQSIGRTKKHLRAGVNSWPCSEVCSGFVLLQANITLSVFRSKKASCRNGIQFFVSSIWKAKIERHSCSIHSTTRMASFFCSSVQ